MCYLHGDLKDSLRSKYLVGTYYPAGTESYPFIINEHLRNKNNSISFIYLTLFEKKIPT